MVQTKTGMHMLQMSCLGTNQIVAEIAETVIGKRAET